MGTCKITSQCCKVGSNSLISTIPCESAIVWKPFERVHSESKTKQPFKKPLLLPFNSISNFFLFFLLCLCSTCEEQVSPSPFFKDTRSTANRSVPFPFPISHFFPLWHPKDTYSKDLNLWNLSFNSNEDQRYIREGLRQSVAQQHCNEEPWQPWSECSFGYTPEVELFATDKWCLENYFPEMGWFIFRGELLNS